MTYASLIHHLRTTVNQKEILRYGTRWVTHCTIPTRRRLSTTFVSLSALAIKFTELTKCNGWARISRSSQFRSKKAQNEVLRLLATGNSDGEIWTRKVSLMVFPRPGQREKFLPQLQIEKIVKKIVEISVGSWAIHTGIARKQICAETASTQSTQQENAGDC